MRTREEFLHYQLCCVGGQCPCGGYWNDGSSHASDCLAVYGNKEYKWDVDRETPKQRNSKRRHDIKGKLTPIYTLAQIMDSDTDIDEMLKPLVRKSATIVVASMPRILELLDEIE